MEKPGVADPRLPKRNITLLYVLSVLAGLSFIYDEILILYYQSFHLTYVQVSITLITTSAFMIAFEAPSGAFADLYGKKKSAILGSVIAITSYLLQFFSTGFIIFLVAHAFWGISVTFFSGTLIAFLHDTLKMLGKEVSFVRYNARYEGTILGTTIITAFLGPVVYTLNKRLPFLFSALFTCVYLVICFFLHEPETTTVKKYSFKTHYKQIKDGITFVGKESGVLWLVLFSLIGITVSRVTGEMIASPYLLQIGYSIQDLGIIALVATSIQVCFIFLTPRLENKLGKTFSWAFIVASIGALLFIMLIVTNVFFALILGLFWGAISFNDLIIQNRLALLTTKENRATVISIHSMVLSIYGIILLPVFGMLMDDTSLEMTILVLGLMVVILGPVFLLTRKKKQKQCIKTRG